MHVFFSGLASSLARRSLSLFPVILDELDFSAAETDRSVRRQSSDRREKVRKGKFLPKKTKKVTTEEGEDCQDCQTYDQAWAKGYKAKAAMKPKPSHLRRALELLDGLLGDGWESSRWWWSAAETNYGQEEFDLVQIVLV